MYLVKTARVAVCMLLSICYLNGRELKVLQFNIWQEGTIVKGGFNAIIDEIIRTKADLVALSEVRNYQNTDLSQRIVKALAEKGQTFYGQKSQDTGIVSRFPIIKQTALFPVKNDRGSITKAIINMNGIRIAFYSAHLDYRNCSYYMVRQYCGSTWKRLSAPVTDTQELLADSRKSKRDDAIKTFISDANIESKKNSLIVLAGDFNEPSHLDWTDAMKNKYDHHGVVISWECTSMLEKAGFTDSYRKIFPNPETHPGFTYPSANKDIPIKRLTWAPKSDERERIDFIFYREDKRWLLKDSIIVGPRKSIAYSKEVDDNSLDKYSKPSKIWPTDHKGLLSTFEMKKLVK